MKKITRLFMALALCGAAFVYTSCTDFTEDIKSVNTRVDNLDKQHSADIKSLQDQAASLQTQITALETAKAAAEKNINLLQNQVAALEAFQKTATEDIASIKTQHELDIKNLKADIATANDNILALQKFQEKAEAQIAALQEAAALLKDTKVDTATFNAAIKKAYEDFAKLDDFNDLKDQYLTLTAGSTMTIAQIETAISTVASNLEQTKSDLSALISLNADKIDSLCTVVSNNYEYVKNEIEPVLTQAVSDIAGINEVLPTLAKTAEVKVWIQNLQSTLSARIKADSLLLQETIANVDTLKTEIDVLKEKKVEVSVYNDKMEELDNNILACVNNIDSLANVVAQIADCIASIRADVDEYMGKVDVLENAFVNRIQSLVFVPEYTDLCAQSYDYVLGKKNELAQAYAENAEADVPGLGNYFDWFMQNFNRGNFGPNPYVRNQKMWNCTGFKTVKASKDESKDFSLGYNVIYGTFQVYPAKLAEELWAQYRDGKVGMLMQFVNLEASRVANDFVPSDALEIISADASTGYIYVRARFASNKVNQYANTPSVNTPFEFVANQPAAISLYVFDNAKAVAETEVEGGEEAAVEVADLGRYICSHYVPVNYNDVDVSKSYCLANVTTGADYPTRYYNSTCNRNHEGYDKHEKGGYKLYGQEISKAWDLVNDTDKADYVDFMEKYAVHMIVDKDTLSLEKAAAALFLPVADITPNLNLSYDYTDYFETAVPATKSFNVAGEFVADTTKAAVEMRDTNDVKTAINWVEDDVTSVSIWTLHTVPVVGAFDTYTIGWRQIELRHALDAQTTYPWTYEFALAHADSQQNPSKENAQPNVTKEVKAVCLNPSQKGFESINFKQLLRTEPSEIFFYETADKTKTLDWNIKVTNGVSDQENLAFTADLATTGYTFVKEGDSDVTAEVHYQDNVSKSEVIVYYDFRYNQHPTDLSFNFAKDDFYYEPTEVKIAIDTFGLGNAVAAKAAYEGYFADNAEFLKSFNNKINSDRSASKAFTGAEERAVSTKSNVSLSKDAYPAVVDNTNTRVFIRLHADDVKTYGDTYKFVNKLTTWYDVNYTINADIALKAPGFKLSYWSNKVVEEGGTELYPAPYAMLEGTYDNQRTNNFPPYILDGTQGAYVVDQDNLSQYYKLTAKDGSDAVVTDAEKQYLRVKYTVETVEDEAAGFKNVPAIETGKDSVEVTYQSEYKNFKFGESPIKWSFNGLDYTARKLATKAKLYCNNVFVNELDLNLYINDPISKYELKEQIVKRPRTQNYDYDTVYFWKNLNIEGILNNGSEKGESVNLIDVDYTGVEGETPYLFGNPYEIKLTFGKSDIQILEYRDFEKEPQAYKDVTDMLGVQMFYNADKGYIVYNNNSAVRQTDLVVKVKLSLEHKFNYLNNPVYEKDAHYKALTYTLLWPKQNVQPGNAE